MKAKILSVLFVLWAFSHVSAQTSEGSVTYAVNVDNLNTGGDAATQAQAESMMKNMKMTMYFKGKNYRMDMDMGMMKNSTLKVDDKTTMLIDAMGTKYKLDMSGDLMKKGKLDDKDYDITYTDDKKTIAGYECKKAVVKTKDGKTSDIYYSDKVFPNPGSNFPYSKFKGGFPLQYTMNRNGTNLTMTATEVSTKPVPADIFTISADYQEMPESMKSQIMGAAKK